jgi:hypothetical protein
MRRACLVAGMVALMAAAGCQFTRQNYQSVLLGQTTDQVEKALGKPRTQNGSEWVYTADDPRDLTMATIWFDSDKKVIGKTWENPDKPWENDRQGKTP